MRTVVDFHYEKTRSDVSLLGVNTCVGKVDR